MGAPALVVEQNATINAAGTRSNQILFTSAVAEKNLPREGLWGGLIILGNAPVFGGTTTIEGLTTGGSYGGNAEDDSSGVLQYVRVWYGGSVIGQDNEINGITFGGVGRGTLVDFIEVAFNLDDGVEFFGGTVDAKHVSVLFAGDDGVDTDQGYQGRLQYVFVVLGENSNHGAEMDGPNIDDEDVPLRSFPQMYNAVFIGHINNDPNPASSDDTEAAVMRLREGTGGLFGNIIITN
eukprot:scaffold3126_cov279-Pinguiococcus_pyrenoidosus.AAC.2